jgi:hypothetical protein
MLIERKFRGWFFGNANKGASGDGASFMNLEVIGGGLSQGDFPYVAGWLVVSVPGGDG